MSFYLVVKMSSYFKPRLVEAQNQMQKKNNVIARKVKANSPQASSTANNSTSWIDKPQPNTPKEFRAWYNANNKAKGLTI